jgi:hypothetical protein
VNRRVALLVVHTNSYFSSLLPVARLLANSGAWEPRFLFARPYPTLPRDQGVCRAEAIAYEGESGDHAPAPLLRGPLARLRNNAAYAAGQHVATMWSLRKLMRERHVALLVLPADNRYDLAAYVKAAHDEGIAAVVIPSFMAAAHEWAQFVHGDPLHALDRLSNRMAASLYPRWAMTYRDKELVALPAHEVLARQWLGIAPPQPWLLHSGQADAIAVESEAMRRYCLLEGLPPRQLVLTGTVDHDRMYERLENAAALREAMYRRLGLPADRPLLLTALPPDQLYDRRRKECEFDDYGALVKLWIESLVAARRFNVVVSLHPSVKRETMQYIEDWGVKIADDSVSAVIPLCDVFVASVSATIQWAIACGKPVLNYDVYRYRYPDYVGVEAVLLVEEQHAYRGALERLTSDDACRAELAAKQARAARYWGLLDGKAGERLLALFTNLSRA